MSNSNFEFEYDRAETMSRINTTCPAKLLDSFFFLALIMFFNTELKRTRRASV